MRRNSILETAVAALCLGAPGCRTEKQAQAPEDTRVDTGRESTPAVAAVSHPEELLPATTLAYFVGKSPRRAAEVFGRDRVAKEFPEVYAGVSGLFVQAVGRDVLDPEALPTLGIDPDGRTGVAVLSASPDVLGLFMTLSDASRFRETVIEVASRANAEILPTSYGGSEVLRDRSGRTAVVIRGAYAVVVVGDDETVPQIAQAIATVDPSRSLSSTRAYRRTIGATAPGDLVGFVDVAELAASDEARRRRFEELASSEPSWQERELEDARGRGEPPERIRELEERVREHREWEASWKTRQEAEQALTTRLFSSFEAISMRVDAKPSGAVFELRMPMSADAFLGRLVRNGQGPPPLSWALDGAPLALLSGTLDVPTLVELADLLAQAQGTTFAEVASKLKAKSSLDLHTLQPLLTGSMGAALTLDGPIDFGSFERGTPKWLGFTVHAEVSDPAAVERLLGELVGKVKPPLRRESGKGEFSFEVPDWRRVYLTVAGRQLVVTTDRLLPERLAKGKAGSIEKKVKPAAAHAAMGLPDAAVTYASDMAAMGWLMFTGRSVSTSFAEVESPETASIPKSRTWQKKKKELDAVEARLRDHQAARETIEVQQILDVVRVVGTTVVVAKRDEHGLWATGGQFVRADGIAGAVLDVIAKTQRLRESETRASDFQELDRLFQESTRLQQELHEIRQADIERVRSRKR